MKMLSHRLHSLHRTVGLLPPASNLMPKFDIKEKCSGADMHTLRYLNAILLNFQSFFNLLALVSDYEFSKKI
jgi:hypothetical protein